MLTLAPCTAREKPLILAIINAAAQKYRGVIPDDRWRDPYMPKAELDREIEAGIVFWGCSIDGELVGVMGVQPVLDVILIRHAYVSPGRQGQGVGAALLHSLMERSSGRVLIGTWRAAAWAIRFYQHQGFRLVAAEDTVPLLRRYWSVPDRQIEESVVLEGFAA